MLPASLWAFSGMSFLETVIALMCLIGVLLVGLSFPGAKRFHQSG
jgi:hypothetical protein